MRDRQNSQLNFLFIFSKDGNVSNPEPINIRITCIKVYKNKMLKNDIHLYTIFPSLYAYLCIRRISVRKGTLPHRILFEQDIFGSDISKSNQV